MTIDIHLEPPLSKPPQTPGEIARQGPDVIADATRRANDEAVRRANDEAAGRANDETAGRANDETAGHAAAAAKDATGALKEVGTDVADKAKEAYQTLSTNVEEGVERTKEYAQHAVDATKDAAHRATDTAKDLYQSAALKAEDTLATSKEYVRENPVLVVVGAVTFGVAVGCMLMLARRQPTLRERYGDEPLDNAHEAFLAALAPFAQRLHQGYDSARNGVGKAMERVQRLNLGRLR